MARELTPAVTRPKPTARTASKQRPIRVACLRCGFADHRLLRAGDTRRYYEIEKTCKCSACGARGSAGLVRVDLLPPGAFAPGAGWAAILFEFLRAAAAPVGAVAGLVLTAALFFVFLAVVNAATSVVSAVGERIERSISAVAEPKADPERLEFCRTRLHWLSVGGPESPTARENAFAHLEARCPEFGRALLELREAERIGR